MSDLEFRPIHKFFRVTISSIKYMNLISAKSRLFTQAELRHSTLMRECTVIINTLTEYDFLKLETVAYLSHI